MGVVVLDNTYDIIHAWYNDDSGKKGLIASGTVDGDGTSKISVNIGKSMPQTDFLFECYIEGGAEIEYSGIYKIPFITMVVTKAMASYDLSSDGNIEPTISENLSWNVDGTDLTCISLLFFKTVRNSLAGVASEKTAVPIITRNEDGFTISYDRGQLTYAFIDEVTYTWKLYYFGDNPSEDIITV